jgi:hypothetical protein
MITVIGQLTDQLLAMTDRKFPPVNNIRNFLASIASQRIGETLIASPDPTKNSSSEEIWIEIANFDKRLFYWNGKVNPSTLRPEDRSLLRVDLERRFSIPPPKAGLSAAEWVNKHR